MNEFPLRLNVQFLLNPSHQALYVYPNYYLVRNLTGLYGSHRRSEKRKLKFYLTCHLELLCVMSYHICDLIPFTAWYRLNAIIIIIYFN
jgi:hypothetical protein